MSHIPTPDEIRAERDPVRHSILEAITRLAEQRPLHVAPGELSVVALAEEAQVKRHWLNQRHKDLRDRFIFLRDNVFAPPPPVSQTAADERVVDLEHEVERLRSRLLAVSDERDAWKASAELFLRAMNVQEVDLARRDTTITRLRQQLERAQSANPTDDELSGRRHRRGSPA